jgi:predicted negative regulator of RcsB-dependent stress response
MKKILLTLSTIITLTIFASSFCFGQFGNLGNPKKMACEKSCSSSYDQCKESANKNMAECKKEAWKIEDANSKKTEEIKCDVAETALKAGCKKSKDECMKKCNK